jgi:hypothetical protein
MGGVGESLFHVELKKRSTFGLDPRLLQLIQKKQAKQRET